MCANNINAMKHVSLQEKTQNQETHDTFYDQEFLIVTGHKLITGLGIIQYTSIQNTDNFHRSSKTALKLESVHFNHCCNGNCMFKCLILGMGLLTSAIADGNKNIKVFNPFTTLSNRYLDGSILLRKGN